MVIFISDHLAVCVSIYHMHGRYVRCRPWTRRYYSLDAAHLKLEATELLRAEDGVWARRWPAPQPPDLAAHQLAQRVAAADRQLPAARRPGYAVAGAVGSDDWPLKLDVAFLAATRVHHFHARGGHSRTLISRLARGGFVLAAGEERRGGMDG